MLVTLLNLVLLLVAAGVTITFLIFIIIVMVDLCRMFREILKEILK